MSQRTWFITGISSGFGREITQQLLARGDRVLGTVRKPEDAEAFTKAFPDTFASVILDVTQPAAVRRVVDSAFAELGHIDVIVSNAGYGLFGAAEELSESQVEDIVATNLMGSIHLIRCALPHLRAQKGGRVIQISSYGGQVAFPGNSMYHATKWGIEGFVESVAQEVAQFGIGMTLVEPGGARTEFRYGSARVATLTDTYADTPAHAFKKMLDPKNGLAAAIRSVWRVASLNRSILSQRRCVWYSVLKHWIRRFKCCASESMVSRHNVTLLLPRISPPANKLRQTIVQAHFTAMDISYPSNADTALKL